jgi:predicted nucleic-acid-binding Zn-ribbon protein
MKKLSIAIASFLLTLIPLAAKANYDALHINKDPYTNLDYQFVVPGTPGQTREFKYEATKQSIINTDNCGWKEFYIDSTSSSLIAIDNYTVAAAEVQPTEPICRWDNANNRFIVQVPFLSKTIGYSTRVGNSLWIKLTNGVEAKTVQIKYTKLKKVTIGECGFNSFKIPEMTGTTILLDGVSSAIDSLPRTSARQLCLKVGGTKQLYRPLSF